MKDRLICPGCRKPPGQLWCWDGLVDCPGGRPPRRVYDEPTGLAMDIWKANREQRLANEAEQARRL